ncbi:MAG: proton-translocating NADH-quinone oxidoreductase, chain [Planctomycetaceae bacterium]|nr:proton-translocating NADH-quinone oxidoreductase, chain [Planctomycetaceae bacterium]
MLAVAFVMQPHNLLNSRPIVLDTLTALSPASVLLAAALVCFLGGTFPVRRVVWGPVCLFSLAAAAITLCSLPQTIHASVSTAEHPQIVVFDALSRIFQFVSLIVGTLFAGMAFRQQAEDEAAPEFYGLLLSLIAGLLIVASANDLIVLFLGLELISIPTYVLIYLGRRDVKCQEAAVKYFLLSVLSAAVLLYGLSFLYGITGSTNLTTIRAVLEAAYGPVNGLPSSVSPSKLGIVALVLIFAGLGFKLAAVPFHFYAPDVYQGTNSWNAGLLAVAPKVAGLIALVRVASFGMYGYEGVGQTVALILALVTMTAGNVLALLQTNVRRMLAYSGVAHAGYMLVGIAVGFWESSVGFSQGAAHGLPGGIQAALFYVIAYSIVSAGMFAVLVFLARPGKEIEHIEDLTGLWKSHPWLAIATTIFLFSLAGLPPLPGFWGKLALFSGALGVRGDLVYPNPSFVLLAVVGMLNAAIAGVYYLRIVALMFLHDPLSVPQPRGGRPALAAVALCTVLTVVLGLQSRPLFGLLREVGELPVATQLAEMEPEASALAAK